ncbi:MAG: DUF3108 domain-containing protein [Lentisphaerae bacterium]|nr:DUF3108 domain-containing protein [Lentisphaerota bacterium]
MRTLAAIACFAVVSLAQAARADDAAGAQLWFPIGERIEYRLYWGVIPVGEAELWTEWAEQDGRRLVALRGRAKSNRFLSRIFPVDDYVESLVDPVTFLPVRYTQKLSEGRHFRHDVFVFDHGNCKAAWTSKITGEQQEVQIDMDTRDVLSFAYFMRKQGFSAGRTERYRVVVDEKVYDLELYGAADQKVEVGDFGEVTALKVEPRASFGGIFLRGGRVMLWFSNDDRHICVRMAGVIPVATAKATLVDVSGPGSEKWKSALGGG